jgi:hypothetical protein
MRDATAQIITWTTAQRFVHTGGCIITHICGGITGRWSF